ncbi:MAG: toxin-antitoxin system YwqK family antitoxin [Sutterella sp.]|nr:toxin-antitoxin system YwqK family antitoxin [Sutterella sp.]
MGCPWNNLPRHRNPDTPGQLREIGHWENGEQNGLFEAWTDKGVLVDHGIFKDGERDGETVQYWPDTGKLKVKAQYRAGKLNGLVEQYYPSGTVQLKHMYTDHQLHGEALDYFENGQLRSSVNFEHGKQSGPFKLFSDDGQLLEEGMLKNGLRHGPFTVYFPQTGKPARQGTYKMNEYDGELTTWRPDGMKVVQTYKNGVANGWQKNYNSQGALMGEIMMKNGRATGEFRAYDSRGNIVQEGTHEDNVVSTVKGMSSPRPEPNEVSPNDNGGIMIKEVNE